MLGLGFSVAFLGNTRFFGLVYRALPRVCAKSDSPFKKSDEGSKKKSKKKEEEKKPRPYHKGASKPVLSPTEIHDCHPEVCPHCGGKEFKKVKQTYSSQHIEITAAPVIVVEDQVYKGKCSQCGHTVSGTVPEEHVQRFGPRISAFIAYLDSLGVTRRQIQEILQDVLGIPISQGGIQKVIDRASDAIVPHNELIAEGGRNCEINHCDETSWRTHGQMGKNLHWLWILGNIFLVFFMVQVHRDREAFLNLIKEWKGILISDDYGIYRSWEYGRQTCLAHLIREARALAESSDQDYAACGKRLLRLFGDICDLVGLSVRGHAKICTIVFIVLSQTMET